MVRQREGGGTAGLDDEGGGGLPWLGGVDAMGMAVLVTHMKRRKVWVKVLSTMGGGGCMVEKAKVEGGRSAGSGEGVRRMG